jgi:hypothetical protein
VRLNLSKIAAMEGKPTHEIDLLQLSAGVLRELKKHWVIAIALPLVGFIIGVFAAKKSERTITSQMFVGTELISRAEGLFLVDQLNETDRLTGMPDSIQHQLRELSYEVTDNGGIDKEDKRVYFKISASVYNENLLPVLQQLVINYFNTCEVTVNNRTRQELKCKEMIARINNELAALDQMKKGVTDGSRQEIANAADLYVKAVDLNEKKLEYELILGRLKNPYVIKGFETLTRQEYTSAGLTGSMGFVIGCIFVGIFILIKLFINYYKTLAY